MNPSFTPPKSDEEFERRAKDIPTDGAKNVIVALNKRKAAMVAAIDEEINFYKKILKQRGVAE